MAVSKEEFVKALIREQFKNAYWDSYTHLQHMSSTLIYENLYDFVIPRFDPENRVVYMLTTKESERYSDRKLTPYLIRKLLEINKAQLTEKLSEADTCVYWCCSLSDSLDKRVIESLPIDEREKYAGRKTPLIEEIFAEIKKRDITTLLFYHKRLSPKYKEERILKALKNAGKKTLEFEVR